MAESSFKPTTANNHRANNAKPRRNPSIPMHKQFHYSVLLQTELNSTIASFASDWIRAIGCHSLSSLLDIGLGAIYRHLANHTHSQILLSLPSYISSSIINSRCPTTKTMTASYRFLLLRQCIYKLRKHELHRFLCTLHSLLPPRLFAAIFTAAFEHYASQPSYQQLLQHTVIDVLCRQAQISSRYIVCVPNKENTLCYGYCRQQQQQQHHQHNIPCDIAQLCFFYFFSLYSASNTVQICQLFGDAFCVENSKFISFEHVTSSMDNMHRRTHDVWNAVLSHKKNRILPSPQIDIDRRQKQEHVQHVVVERVDEANKHEWFNAFGTDLVEFTQRKVWRLRVTPYFGNMLIGIAEHSDCRQESNQYAVYNDKNGRDFSFRAGCVGYMPVCGKLFFGDNQVLMTQSKYDYIAKSREFIVKVVLDMTALDVQLAFEVNGKPVGEMKFNREIITAHKRYRLAIAMHEAQKVEILHSDRDVSE